MQDLSEKGNITRARIVETARELFHKNGVRATSVDQILEASGTGKSQFYHYFSSKEDIVREVLRFYKEVIKSGQGPIRVEIDSWEGLENYFNDHLRGIRTFNYERACPIGSIGNELAAENEDIRQDVNAVLDISIQKITEFFESLKKAGKLKKTADPKSLANFSLASLQGAMLLSKFSKDPVPAENTVKHALTYLKSFSK